MTSGRFLSAGTGLASLIRNNIASRVLATVRSQILTGCKLCSKVTHEPYSGCQRRHCKLSVRPCWTASLLYFAMAISREILLFIYLGFRGRRLNSWLSCVSVSKQYSFKISLRQSLISLSTLTLFGPPRGLSVILPSLTHLDTILMAVDLLIANVSATIK